MSQVRALTGQPTAVRRTLLVPEQLADWVPSACAVVAEHLRHHGIAPTGYPFTRCHPSPDGITEAEAGFPVDAPIANSGVVEPSTLPGGPVLAVWHTDPDVKLAETYHAIAEWLETEGAHATGDSWEIYHDLPTCDHVGVRIEILQPITFVHP
ncbi:GyrI-like domain-containing protein [Kribbella sp. NPDC048928]|uniref:GyrI-like domain-containing protein n=1 Tax=Kribbella sp. NPDC048928 TaxID=3364111 RepID=UPI003718EDA7